MSTVTATPDNETGSITLDILKTSDITSITRTNVNGTSEVRLAAGQLPSSASLGVVRTNLITNPSFETGTTGYTLMTTLSSTLSNPTTGGKYGSRHARVTTTATSGTDAFSLFGVKHTLNLTGGKTYVVSFYGRGSNGVVMYQPDVYVAGVYVNNGINYQVVDNGWTRMGKRFTVSGTGTKSVQIGFGGYYDNAANGGTGGTPVGSYVDLDGILIEESATSPGTYFDGATTDVTGYDYAWTGTAHASTSTLTTVGGRLIVVDYEAGHGLNTYNVFTTGGAFDTGSATLELDKPWLMVPIAPNYSEQVEVITNYSANRQTHSTTHVIINRPDPLVTMGRLSTRSGTLEFWAANLEEVNRIARVFDRGEAILLKQTVSGLDMYFSADQVSADPFSVEGPEHTKYRISVQYTEVIRPYGNLAGAIGWTYDALSTAYTSYSAVNAAFASYDDLTIQDTK